MDVDEHVVPAGQHYSGRNRVPNIKQFVQQLDSDKKKRDAAIDAELKQNTTGSEAQDHENQEKPKRRDLRTVRDPVTGKDVDIQDAKTNYKDAVDNPQARPPAHDCREPSS